MATKGIEFYCNSCCGRLELFKKPSAKLKAHLTNCQHVFCDNCRKKIADKCAECGKACRLMEIDDKMPNHLKHVFQPSQQLQSAYTTGVKFQIQQDKIRIKNYDKMVIRYDGKFKEERLRYEEYKKGYFKAQQRKAALTAFCRGFSLYVR